MDKTDVADPLGSTNGIASYNALLSGERCEALQAPSGPSSLAKINSVGDTGVCNAFSAPLGYKNSTLS